MDGGRNTSTTAVTRNNYAIDEIESPVFALSATSSADPGSSLALRTKGQVDRVVIVCAIFDPYRVGSSDLDDSRRCVAAHVGLPL